MMTVKELQTEVKRLCAAFSHYEELLGNVVEHVSVAENTSTQIETLQTDYGFTREDLLHFGYSEEDIDDTEENTEE